MSEAPIVISDPPIQSRNILGVRVNASTYDEVAATVRDWSTRGLSRTVNVLAVHGVMEAYDDPDFRQIINDGDINTSDGVPVVWALKLLGARNATRVYGPELTPRLLEMAANDGIPVGLYGGSSPEALDRLVDVLKRRFDGLKIAYAWSPPKVEIPDIPLDGRPYRQLTSDEDSAIRQEIIESGVRLLFVGLGCPKQERWMHAHRTLPTVMVGVGAAFDFLAGNKAQAPRFIQNAGLEWLFRLLTEPRRLWKRYLKHNPRFVLYVAMQRLGLWRFDIG